MTASAQLTGPPIIDAAAVFIDPPVAGATVRVFVRKLDNSDANTEVWVANTTRGTSTVPQAFDPVLGSYVKITGGSGDALRVHARNAPDEASQLVGFVPSAADQARPEFAFEFVTGPEQADSSGDYHVLGDAGAIQDESFPVTLTTTAGSPASVVLTGGQKSTVPFDVTIPGSYFGERVTLTVTDNFGNQQSLSFTVGDPLAAPADSFFPTSYASADQALSENTGADARYGDVLLAGRELVTRQTLTDIAGATSTFPVEIVHRSGIGYDGPLGCGWDWALDSRVKRVVLPTGAAEVRWIDGSGRLHVFTNETLVTIPWCLIYDSPPGVDRRLRFQPGTGARFYLEDATGSQLIFHAATGLLEKHVDAYGNTVELIRDHEDRLVEVVDDEGRRFPVTWLFCAGGARVAEIRDFGGRAIRFDYDTSGRLSSITSRTRPRCPSSMTVRVHACEM